MIRVVDNDTPQAETVVHTSRRLPMVWLVPVVAIAIGGWLIYHNWSVRGPTIDITFDNASGLEAGKTKLKLRDVDIGQVSDIRLGETPSFVVVRAEITKDAERFIRSDSQFWVVRPRVQGANVSGLGTLISGAYIAVKPGTGSEPQYAFEGLGTPPVGEGLQAGSHFELEAERRGNLSPGAPVYYRGIEVGEVTSVELVEQFERLSIGIFVESPHDKLVRQSTRFWNASGISMSVGADGVDVQVASLEALIRGGVAFETLDDAAVQVAEHHRFRLFNDRDSIDDAAYSEKIRYVMYFDNSVRGLSVGAPVEFRGIRIGSVIKISVEFDQSEEAVRIPVIVDIEPERIEQMTGGGGDTELDRRSIESLIDLGLRAQLQTGNLLTGKLFVAFDFHPDAPPRYLGLHEQLPEIPTVTTVLGQFGESASAIMHKLEAMPLDELSRNLVGITDKLNTLLASKEIDKTLRESRRTAEKLADSVQKFEAEIIPRVDTVIKSYDEDSPMYLELIDTLAELRAASAALGRLAEDIEREPEILLRGRR